MALKAPLMSPRCQRALTRAKSAWALVSPLAMASSWANAGALYLFTMPLSGSLSASAAAARFEPDSSGDDACDYIGPGADFDGNGYVDILLAAPGDSAGGAGAGSAFLFYAHGL